MIGVIGPRTAARVAKWVSEVVGREPALGVECWYMRRDPA
jgi:hypothetical protein